MPRLCRWNDLRQKDIGGDGERKFRVVGQAIVQVVFVLTVLGKLVESRPAGHIGVAGGVHGNA